MVDAAPMATPLPDFDEPLTVIESSPLPAPVAMAESAPVAPPVSVALDYADIAAAPAAPGTASDLSSYTYAPIAPPIQSTPLDDMSVPAQDFAGLQPPTRDDVDQVASYYDLRAPKGEDLLQQAGLPTAIPAPAPAVPVLRTPAPAFGGGGLTRPVASTEYLRPYEALPPGFFPPYDFGPAGDALSQAPAPAPQYVATQPFAPVDQTFAASTAPAFTDVPLAQASVATVVNEGATTLSYTVQSGDTLYGIARIHGSTAEAIARRNGIDDGGVIYPGNTLTIPDADITIGGGPDSLGDAPIVVLETAQAVPVDPVMEEATSSTFVRDMTDQPVEMIDLSELAQMYSRREGGGGTMPLISAEAGDALRGRVDMTPTEVISNPRGSMAPAYEPVSSHTASHVSAATPVAHSPASYAWPVHGEVYRLASGQIDIVARLGAPVSASAPGRVVGIENGSRGTLVVIEHDDGWRSLTLGLAAANVSIGQRVTTGTFLGTAGMDRIRFELRDGDARIAETLGILGS